MATVTQDQVQEQAKRIAQVWDIEGFDAAAYEFGKQCREWDLLRWQQSAFADAVRSARKQKD